MSDLSLGIPQKWNQSSPSPAKTVAAPVPPAPAVKPPAFKDPPEEKSSGFSWALITTGAIAAGVLAGIILTRGRNAGEAANPVERILKMEPPPSIKALLKEANHSETTLFRRSECLEHAGNLAATQGDLFNANIYYGHSFSSLLRHETEFYEANKKFSTPVSELISSFKDDRIPKLQSIFEEGKGDYSTTRVAQELVHSLNGANQMDDNIVIHLFKEFDKKFLGNMLN